MTKQIERAASLRAMIRTVRSASTRADSPTESALLETAAEELQSKLTAMERARTEAPAVATLPDNATADELKASRRRQATRRGQEVYLPALGSTLQVVPSALLRSGLFGAGRSVAASNEAVIAGDRSLLVADDETPTFANASLLYTGYPLCQTDRRIYSACLSYYRDRPLEPAHSQDCVQTTFRKFAAMMGSAYSDNLYVTCKAGLLRLSSGNFRLRMNEATVAIPKLLGVTFIEPPGKLRPGAPSGADIIMLQVGEECAELFGPGCWTAVDAQTAKLNNLPGWVANFYATHSAPFWLPLESLYRLSRYESSYSDFIKSFLATLESLKAASPESTCHIVRYKVSKDGTKVWVQPGKAEKAVAAPD